MAYDEANDPVLRMLRHEAKAAGARLGAYLTPFRHDSRKLNEPGRIASALALNERLLAEINATEPSLSESERAARLTEARRDHFRRLASISMAARRAKAEAREGAAS